MTSSSGLRASTRILWAFLVIVFGLISLGSFVSAVAVFGKRDVVSGCAEDAPRPTVGGPYFEDTQVVKAERTLVPLGVICVLDSPDDRVGPQTVRIQSWPDTVTWIAAGTVALLGLFLLVRPPGLPDRSRT